MLFLPPIVNLLQEKKKKNCTKTIKRLQVLETKTAVYCDFCFKSWSGTQRQVSPIFCAVC